MKKFLYCILLLSITGALLSALLTVEYYYPEMSSRVISCGDGIADPCFTVSQSRFSSLFSVPLAVLGLYFYLVLIFSLLVADYAGDVYYRWAAGLVLVLAGASLAADAVLGILLIYMKQLCTHCIATYVINLLIFITAVFWVKNIPGFTFRLPKPGVQNSGEGTHHQRAALSLALIAGILLFFTIFSTSRVLKEKTYLPAPHTKEIAAFMKDFYATPPENMSLHPAMLTLGPENAPVRITVFTDFLCSACYEFYLVEKSLFARYPGRIHVSYYNYPLDGDCNRYVRHTRYRNSCSASRAAIAAGAFNSFDNYIVRHFRNYKRFHNRYTENTALPFVQGITDKDLFLNKMSSDETTARLTRDIEEANRLRVNATPTLFINGRRIEGVPPKEFLYAVVEQELQRTK